MGFCQHHVLFRLIDEGWTPWHASKQADNCFHWTLLIEKEENEIQLELHSTQMLSYERERLRLHLSTL